MLGLRVLGKFRLLIPRFVVEQKVNMYDGKYINRRSKGALSFDSTFLRCSTAPLHLAPGHERRKIYSGAYLPERFKATLLSSEGVRHPHSWRHSFRSCDSPLALLCRAVRLAMCAGSGVHIDGFPHHEIRGAEIEESFLLRGPIRNALT
jgi:hypothetical protein